MQWQRHRQHSGPQRGADQGGDRALRGEGSPRTHSSRRLREDCNQQWLVGSHLVEIYKYLPPKLESWGNLSVPPFCRPELERTVGEPAVKGWRPVCVGKAAGCQAREIANLLSTNLLSRPLDTHVATPSYAVAVSSFSSSSIGRPGRAVCLPHLARSRAALGTPALQPPVLFPLCPGGGPSGEHL